MILYTQLQGLKEELEKNPHHISGASYDWSTRGCDPNTGIGAPADSRKTSKSSVHKIANSGAIKILHRTIRLQGFQQMT